MCRSSREPEVTDPGSWGTVLASQLTAGHVPRCATQGGPRGGPRKDCFLIRTTSRLLKECENTFTL